AELRPDAGAERQAPDRGDRQAAALDDAVDRCRQEARAGRQRRLGSTHRDQMIFTASRTAPAYASSPSISANSRHGRRFVPQTTKSCVVEWTIAAPPSATPRVTDTRSMPGAIVQAPPPGPESSSTTGLCTTGSSAAAHI